jgi:YD repeat-containing protein
MSARRHAPGGIAAVVAIATTAAMFASAKPAQALQGPAPGSVSPNKLKLPDGPASVHGLGDKASPNLFSGQVGYSVPIDLPKGPGGFGPQLALTYSGDLGNGPVGIGWTLPGVAIRRSTQHGVPRYDESDELEIVGLGGGRLVKDTMAGQGRYWVEGRGLSLRVLRRETSFEITDSSGTHYFLGLTAEGRLAEGERVAGWFVQRIVNVAGQEVKFTYSHETGQIYLRTIAWGPIVSGAPAYLVTLSNEERPDDVTSFRTGFAVKTAARLMRVEVKAFGSVARSYQLTYDNSLHLSRLRTITLFGRGDAASGLAPLTFTYGDLQAPSAVSISGTGGWILNDRDVSFADVDGDGAADLLRLEAGNHAYRKNRNGILLEARSLSGAGDVDFQNGSLIDLDGDARPELVRIVDDTWRAYRLTGESWQSMGEWPGTRNVPIHDGAWVLADVNGDGRTDAVQGRTGGISVRLNGPSAMSSPVNRPPISERDAEVQPGERNVRFLDANGDGLVDVVWLTDAWMKIFLGRGDGTFVPFDRVVYPWREQALQSDAIQFGDLNRDGLIDLVRITAAQVQWFAGRSDLHFVPVPRTLARPPGTDAESVVTIADANGNGSQDVVWSASSGLWVLDLAGATSAGMLTAIENGLGQITRFEYTASAALSGDADRSGSPWEHKLPTSIPIPTRVEVDPGGGGPVRVSEHSVRDGLWDGVERRFGGFLQSLSREIGSGPATTLIEERRYHAGLGVDRELRGSVWWSKRSSEAGYVFDVVKTTFEALEVAPLAHLSSDLLRVARPRTQSSLVYEGQTTPIESRIVYQYDSLGRAIEEKHWGIFDVPGDERVVRRAYVNSDDTTWIRDLVREEQIRELNGTVVGQTKTYYGAQSGSVLPSGEPGLGYVRRVDALAQSSSPNNTCASLTSPREVVQATTQYDSCGNPTDLYESGVSRHLTYEFCLFPTTETVQPNTGSTLTWSMTWDHVLGVPTELIDPNTDGTHVGYDQIGRPTDVKVVGYQPHIHYQYDWSHPLPTTTTWVYDRVWSTLQSSNVPPGAGWRATTTVSNGAGEALYSTMAVGDGRTIVSGWKAFDERGAVRLSSEPFYAMQLPPGGPPVGARVQTFQYDAAGRTVAQTLPNGATKQTLFGITSNYAFQDVQSPELATVHSELDGLGRVVLTTRELTSGLESVAATYDAAGRIGAMSLQSGAVVHRFEYDTLGRMIFASDPDTGERHLCYDDRNLLVEHVNGENQHVFFEYDDAARLKRRGETSDPDTRTDYSYTYDDPTAAFSSSGCHVKGRLARVVEPTGVANVMNDARFCYDVAGRSSTVGRSIIAPTGARTGWARVDLSPSGFLLAESFDDGFTTTRTYDGAGRAQSIASGGSTLWQATALDAAGRVEGESYGNGATETYGYDTLGLPAHVHLRSTVSGQTRDLFEIFVTRTPYGAPLTVTDQDGNGDSLNHSATYTYDDAARLTGATLGATSDPGGGKYAFGFAYDHLQNMISRTVTQQGMSGPAQPKDIGVLTGTYRYGGTNGERGYGPRQLTSVVP